MSKRLQSPLIQLQSAIEQRVDQEADYAARFLGGASETEKSLVWALQQVDDQHRVWLQSITEQHALAASEINQTIDDHLINAQSERQMESGEIERACDVEKDEIETRFQESTWVATSLLDDTAEDSPRRQFERTQFSIQKSREDLTTLVSGLKADSQTLAAERGWNQEPHFEPQPAPKQLEKLGEKLQVVHERGRQELSAARGLILPKLFFGFRSLFAFLWLAVLAGGLFFWLMPPQLGVTLPRVVNALET